MTLNDLINQIKLLDLKCEIKPPPDIFKERPKIQTEIDLITSEQTEISSHLGIQTQPL